MLSVTIKNYTKEAHARLEHRMLPCIRRVKDKEDYRRLLGLFYGFYKPVEDSLGTQFATDSLVRDLGAAPDIRYTGWTAPRHPMGARYVLEGSMLGGPHIAAMIERQVGAPLPFYFFRRAAAGERWNGFVERINTVPSEEHADVLDAALATFDHFNYWIEHYDNT